MEFAYFVCCVLVGSGFCYKLITRAEDCYRVCVCVWPRNLNSETPYALVRLLHHRQK